MVYPRRPRIEDGDVAVAGRPHAAARRVEHDRFLRGDPCGQPRDRDPLGPPGILDGIALAGAGVEREDGRSLAVPE